MGILVRAFREGFYKGERRRAGDEFEVGDNTLVSGWFDPVDSSVKLKPRPELTPAQKAEVAKQARAASKRAERARIAGKKPAPQAAVVALSQLHAKEPARVEHAQVAEAGEGNEPLA